MNSALVGLLLLAVTSSGAAPAPAGEPASPSLGPWQAVALGLVEGVTEYLPVSSTGHLILTARLLGLGDTPEEREAADAYAICIQAGAILAVLLLYRRRAAQLLQGLVGRHREGRRLLLHLILAFVPAAVLGLLASAAIKAHLFGLWPVVAAWLGWGVVLVIVGRRGGLAAAGRPGRGLEELTWKAALAIGLWQTLALWPGTSRSLVTLLGGLGVGLSLAAALEFSFLLGLVTLSAATAHDLLRHGDAMVASFGWATPLLGFAVATVAALLSVRWLVGFLDRRGVGWFGVYRIVLALVVGLALSAGWRA
ncbi:MAG: undecaprenyl-diphosphate phosphatase [Myxococcota bacterium]|jgi:undecaprenyl-diphosphatase|nr:undecaprenyl-diphosphate phosphatase [Myxococcota bacterium]